MTEFWDKQKVLKSLKITDKHLKRMREQGAPSPLPFKGYDIKALCEWIVAKPMKRSDRTQVRQFAQKVLTKFSKQSPTQEPAEEVKTSRSVTGRANFETGLVAALDRARSAEVAAYKAHLDFVKKSGIVSAACLDTWQKALDILRKCEKDFGEVLERRRELVEMKQVQDWLESHIEQIKTILLNLPAKVAPEFESLPWPEIQKRLTQEIRDAISKLGQFV